LEEKMSVRGRTFANHWVSNNINPEPYQPEGNNTAARQKAEELLAEAEDDGISAGEIEEEVGGIVDFISAAMEESTDNEVRRLAGKDD
jgi:hypothetical protein